MFVFLEFGLPPGGFLLRFFPLFRESALSFGFRGLSRRFGIVRLIFLGIGLRLIRDFNPTAAFDSWKIHPAEPPQSGQP